MPEQPQLPFGPPTTGKDWTFKPCVRPMTLQGAMVHTGTGEVKEMEFERRCGTRRAEDCPACSEIWKGDAFHALMQGAKEHKGELTFITLTAPGWRAFGHTHTASHSGAVSERCACRQYHAPGDAKVGLPVDTDTFDYDAVAAFNAAAPRLTALTMQKVWRLMGGKEHRMPTARVMEWQARGVLHAHVMVLGHVPADVVRDAVLGRPKAGNCRSVAPSSHKGWSWGAEVDVRHIKANAGRELVNYILKVVDYAIKDVTAHVPDASASKSLRRLTRLHQERLNEAGEKSSHCVCSKLDCHHGWVISSGPEGLTEIFGARTDRRCRRHKRAGKQYGFTGNVLSMNRSWGSSLGQARERRSDFTKAGSPRVSQWLSLGWRAIPATRAALAARLEPVKKVVTQSPSRAAAGSRSRVGEADEASQLRFFEDPGQSERTSPDVLRRKVQDAAPH